MTECLVSWLLVAFCLTSLWIWERSAPAWYVSHNIPSNQHYQLEYLLCNNQPHQFEEKQYRSFDFSSTQVLLIFFTGHSIVTSFSTSVSLFKSRFFPITEKNSPLSPHLPLSLKVQFFSIFFRNNYFCNGTTENSTKKVEINHSLKECTFPTGIHSNRENMYCCSSALHGFPQNSVVYLNQYFKENAFYSNRIFFILGSYL